MKIILGYECDAGAYPDALEGGNASIGRAVVGPSGFLNILETHLGLRRKNIHHAVRIAQYLKALSIVDNGKRFYSESYKADPWAVAKELLAWRDELVMGGWNGVIIAEGAERLNSFHLIEAEAHPEFAPGVGDRIREIIPELKKGTDPGIGVLTLLEPRNTWPFLWREVFSSLEKHGATVSEFSPPDRGEAEPPCIPEVSLLVSDTETEAAETVASWLLSEPTRNDSVLFITGGGSLILDSALQRFGLPRLGADTSSPWRAAIQVLGLVLSNLWAPFDPYKLLELLVVPRSPIPKRFAHHLEAALREHPGLGGSEWEEAWRRIDREFRNEKAGGEPSSSEEMNKLAGLFLQELNSWIGGERHDPSSGIPAEITVSICEKVKEWARRLGGLEEDPLLLAASVIAEDAKLAIKASGLSSILRPQLHRILDAVTGEGLKDPSTFAEAAPWSQVSAPGQVWGNAETIIWWNCISSNSHFSKAAWTDTEKRSLAASGVFLQSPAEKRLRDSVSWDRALRFAAKRLLLIFPRMVSGEPTLPHPFIDEIRQDGGRTVLDVSRYWTCAKVDLCGRTIERKEVFDDPPPVVRKEWPIEKGGSWERNPESYSSMSLLIQCPLAWFFNYILGLKRGIPLSLPSDSAMLGTLAHAIVESLFSESPEWTPQEAGKRAMELFLDLVPKMAAPLLLPGREIDFEWYKRDIPRSIENLVRLIVAAGWEVQAMETEMIREFLSPGRTFTGRIDMMLKTADGGHAIWDLKWASRSKYRAEEMTKGQALQLAAYCWLVGGKGYLPPGAYYMLSQGELISSPCKGLSETCQYPGVDLKEIWEKAVEKYTERLDDLSGGALSGMGQIPGEKVKPGDSAGFDLDPPCRWCDYATLCGLEKKA